MSVNLDPPGYFWGNACFISQEVIMQTPHFFVKVQYIEEVNVVKNAKLPITAKHDSYGISFEIDDAKVDRGEISSGVPLWDPAWKVSYDHVKEWNQQIVSACAQNPSEYRKIADIAVKIGVRPNKYGVPSEEAIKFCTRMMS